MRIVLIAPSFPKLSESFIVSKFLGLLKRGWDVHILCAESDPAQWRNFPTLRDHSGCRDRVRVGWPHRPAWLAALLLPVALAQALCRNPRGTLRYLRRGACRFGKRLPIQFYLDADLLSLAPDVVHFEFGSLAIGRDHVGELLGSKVVVSFRGYDVNFAGLGDEGFYTRVWQSTHLFHFLGSDLRARGLRRGCPADKPYRLISPAIDPSYFKPIRNREGVDSKREESPLRLLSVGRLEWKKGYEFALQSIAALRDAGVPCLYQIVGGGAFLEPLITACHQLGITDRVQFLGPLPHTEVLDLLDKSDVFLHPAVSEGFCNAVLEAQSMAVPVVCTDAGGLAENVCDGETGFVVSRRDPQAMATKLEALWRDPALRARMGRAGRERVLIHFRIEDQILKFEELYRTLGYGDQNSANRV